MKMDNPAELHGQIETLGCHPNYGLFTLGRVVLSEVLDRLLNKGAKSNRVETYNYLNTAFQFYCLFDLDVVSEDFIFRKVFWNKN
jgi:hypothetical protein